VNGLAGAILSVLVEAIMTETGVELLRALRSVRGFFTDLSQLLVTAQMLMARHGWETKDAYCLFGLSYSVSQGDRWLPCVAWRRLTNAAFPGTVAIISVLLGDYDKSTKLEEPVVSAGVFLMSHDQAQLETWNACWCGWSGVPAAGQSNTITNTDGRHPDWGWRVHRYFAQPLVAISNQEALQRLIIDPLLVLLDDCKKETTAAPA
jgi:hypothetical protein